MGDPETRLDRIEPELNANLPGDPRDTTTPRAMVQAMQRVLTGDALTIASNHQLIAWLIAWPPERAPVLLAIYTSGSQRSVEELSGAHAQVAAVIADAWG